MYVNSQKLNQWCQEIRNKIVNEPYVHCVPQWSQDLGDEDNYNHLPKKEMKKDFWFLIDLIAHSSGNIGLLVKNHLLRQNY